MAVDVNYETGRVVAVISHILGGLRPTTLDLIVNNGPNMSMGPLLAKATPKASKAQADLLGRIIRNIHDWPGHMTMKAQGAFWLGYEHQRQKNG